MCSRIIVFKITNFKSQKKSDYEADLRISDYWSQYFESEKVSKIMIQVKKVSRSDDLFTISPFAEQIYSDSSYKETTEVTEGVNITRQGIGNLEDGKWYIWLAIPSYRASTNGNAYTGSYISDKIGKVQTKGNFSEVFSDVYLDFRGFKLCQWSKEIGCQEKDSIH